jgi:lipopolysaccharide transport system permease protein
MLSAIWKFRKFIWNSAKRELVSRYRGSVLGSIWVLLNPLASVLIYTVIFTQVMRARLPLVDDSMSYGLFLCAGIIPWSFFAEVLTRSSTMFIEQSNLIKKANFPRSAVPAVVAVVASVNLTVIFSIFLLFLILMGRFPGWSILGLAPLLLLQLGFASGLGLIFGTINIFFRDVGQALVIFLQFWFWLTPIVYPISILPDLFQKLMLQLNPMAHLILAYQNVVLYDTWPNWRDFQLFTLATVVSLLFGFLIFKKLSNEMVDDL